MDIEELTAKQAVKIVLDCLRLFLLREWLKFIILFKNNIKIIAFKLKVF